MPSWIFERYGRTGGISGEGVTNALEGGGWTAREDLLAREAIQNSVDALDRDGGQRKARVRFRRRVLTGIEKRAFLDQLQFETLGEHAAPQQVPGHESAFVHADNLGKELELLYVEDFGTVGLGGGLQDPKRGHFYRLLFLVGEGGKAYEGGHTGGSYGFGKAVYSNNSNVATIVVHSVFAPTAQTEGHHARLLGCSFFRGHEHDGVNYTGRAWLGERAHDEPEAPIPLVDEDACALAEAFGFVPRTVGENGTSILIVGSDRDGKSLDMARLRHAIETWWWPLLVHSNLDIELWDGDELMPPPQPRRSEREDLRPFIEAWLAFESPDPEFYEPAFNRVQHREIGRLMLRSLDEDEVAAYVEDDEEELDTQIRAPGPRKVALIRSPCMVVAYHAVGSAGKPPFIGVFRAHDDVDQALKLSEPPAHDRWDPVARRLENEPNGKHLVETVLQRIKVQARNYQSRLSPPKPRPKERLTWLDQMLGKMLRYSEKRQPPPPDGEKGAVSAHFDSSAVQDGDRLHFHARVELALKDRLDVESAEVVFKPVVNVLEGEAGQKGDPLHLRIFDATGQELTSGTEPEYALTVHKDERIALELVSESYSPDWTVNLHVEIEPVVTA